jgi:hypothetical protein
MAATEAAATTGGRAAAAAVTAEGIATAGGVMTAGDAATAKSSRRCPASWLTGGVVTAGDAVARGSAAPSGRGDTGGGKVTGRRVETAGGMVSGRGRETARGPIVAAAAAGSSGMTGGEVTSVGVVTAIERGVRAGGDRPRSAALGAAPSGFSTPEGAVDVPFGFFVLEAGSVARSSEAVACADDLRAAPLAVVMIAVGASVPARDVIDLSAFASGIGVACGTTDGGGGTLRGAGPLALAASAGAFSPVPPPSSPAGALPGTFLAGWFSIKPIPPWCSSRF